MFGQYGRYGRCYLSCLASGFLVIGVGMTIAYPSPAFPDINHGHYGFKMSLEVMSWLASFAGLFAVPGSVVLVPFMDRYGRKFAFMLILIPATIGWLLAVIARDVITFAASRAILGAVIGLVYSCIPIYLSEIAPKEIRGFVGSSLAVCAYSGGLITNLTGSFINWKWIAIVALATVALAGLSSFVMYETPRWLITNGYREAAAEVLSEIRGLKDPELVKQEVNDIESIVKSVKRLGFCEGIAALVKPPLLKPFIITHILLIFQQFTGAAYIHSYTVTIFRQATSSLHTNSEFLKNPNYQASMAIGVFVLGSIVAMFVIDRWGRRKLLLSSAVGLTVALAALGAYYFVLASNKAMAQTYLFWLPMLSLMLYDFGYGVAFGGIPILLLSELFPLKVRAVANGLGSLNHNICFFIVVKVFPTLKSVPNYGIFWIYASAGFLSFFFIYYFIPETKGRSLEEIEKELGSKKPPETTADSNANEEDPHKMTSRL